MAVIPAGIASIIHGNFWCDLASGDGMKGLCLRVIRQGLEDEDFPLHDSLSIGRGEDNTIILDDPAVNATHAVVSAWPGEPRLECFGDAVLMFPDGTAVRELPITPGVTFIVGSALIQCVGSETPQQCPRCFWELSAIAGVARFCPRCGMQLAPVPVDPVPVPAVDRQAELAAISPATGAHSLILIGYAAAMTNLGCRYETGFGMPRNEDEAIRCYIKAARLGNSLALERLSSRGIAMA
jgi:hypothetical protein